MTLFVLVLHVLKTAFGFIFLKSFSLYYFFYHFVCFIVCFTVHAAIVRIKLTMMSNCKAYQAECTASNDENERRSPAVDLHKLLRQGR